MKFGFDELTPRAARKLSEDGFRVVKENDGKKWAIYTDNITSELENRDIDQPEHTFGVVKPGQSDYQTDAAQALISDNVRYWYCKVCRCGPNEICTHNNPYYYMFGDCVYVSFRIRSVDNRATSPTVTECVIFDIVLDPGSIRDILNSRPAAVRGMLF